MLFRTNRSLVGWVNLMLSLLLIRRRNINQYNWIIIIIMIIISVSSEQIISLFFYECFVEKINQRTFSLLQKWLAFNLKSNKRNIKLTQPTRDLFVRNNILFWFVYQGFLHRKTPNCRHWIARHFFLLAIVFSVLLRYMDSDSPFGVFKHSYE
jgi:hypothetical protein